MTLDSLLRNASPAFEIIVVDQSDDFTTRDVVARRADSRLRYVGTSTRGLSRARNIGIAEAAAQIVLMTDDDCEVPEDWVSRMVSAFGTDATRGAIFCDVLVGPFDPKLGFIPGCRVQQKVFRTIREAINRLGLGAGFAVRKSVVMKIGGFDPLLGAGAEFQSGEEHDVAYRMMLAGFQTACTQETHVVHHGFRTFSEGRILVQGYARGHAAIYGKLARCGYASQVLPAFCVAFWVHAVRPLSKAVMQWHRPFGFNRLRYFVIGFARGLVAGVDRRSQTFALKPEGPGAAAAGTD